MHTLPGEVEPIGTSTLFAAWNAAIYVAQIEDVRHRTQSATTNISKAPTSAEEIRRSLVQRRNLCDLAPPRPGLIPEGAVTAPDLVPSRDLAALLSSASVEVSSRGHQLAELRDHFVPGTDVTITFLPGDNYRHNVETATALRRAGYNPVPHIAAREMASREALDDFLARLRGEAEVTRILLISGDTALARGPFKSSLDVRASGLLEARGITRVGRCRASRRPPLSGNG